MQVVHLGCDIQRASGYISPEIKTLCEKPFLLFVSTIERRKNHETLYRAYVELINQGVVDLPQLLFVGKIGWGVDDLLKDLQLDPRTHSYIQVLNHVTDAELAVLYESALFTLYPSLYEGWGLPIAESLAHGKFCLTSNNSSLPEVGQDYVEYLNAWDVPSWANKIAWYCKNPQALHEKEQRILANYRATSWQDSSKSILKSAADLLPSQGLKIIFQFEKLIILGIGIGIGGVLLRKFLQLFNLGDHNFMTLLDHDSLVNKCLQGARYCFSASVGNYGNFMLLG